MATTVGDRVCVDTNILIYERFVQSPFHSISVRKLAAMESSGCQIIVSHQVLREFMAATSRGIGLTAPLSASEVLADIRYFLARFQTVADGASVMSELLKLMATVPIAGRQIYDANIVATMLAHGISRLLTHNTADFQRFAAHIAIEPLVP